MFEYVCFSVFMTDVMTYGLYLRVLYLTSVEAPNEVWGIDLYDEMVKSLIWINWGLFFNHFRNHVLFDEGLKMVAFYESFLSSHFLKKSEKERKYSDGNGLWRFVS